MKVAVVTTRHDAQDDRIYFKEACTLAGWMDVLLVAPDDGEALNWKEGVRHWPIPRRRGGIGRLRSVVDSIRAVRSLSPDFVHLHDLDLVLAIPFLRLATNCKIIYDSHEVFTKFDIVLTRGGGWWARCIGAVVSGIENLCVRFADGIVTAVDPGDLAFRNLKVPQWTVYNFPPLKIFEWAPDRVEREAAKYAGRLPIIYQGSMSEERGLFHMLQGVALIARKEPRILLRLVGIENGELRDRAKEMVESLGIRKQVEFTGKLPHKDVALAMKTSLIGLVPLQDNPKYRRALPIKLLEYMACGIPVLSSNFGLIKKYTQDSGGGIVYDSSSSESFAIEILKMLGDEEMRKKMGASGQRMVCEKWELGGDGGVAEERLWLFWRGLISTDQQSDV